MTLKFGFLGSLICCVVFIGNAAAAQTESVIDCPVRLEHLDLRYNHAGGQSAPQLKLAFTNRTEKTITGLTLTLSVLDTAGNTHPYPEDLTYNAKAIPGLQPRTFIWNLASASIDMHHAGESVTLQKVQYSDGTAWKDNGSSACTLSVDFHAK